MTPLGLKIALHYYISPEPWPDLDAPAHRECIAALRANGLLSGDGSWDYVKTPGLDAFVERLMAVPFPVQVTRWEFAPDACIEQVCS